jgi:O-succinylbenzoic acid--CoA ligase
MMNDEKMPNPLIKRVFLTPNRPAIKFQEREYTFRELYDLSYQTAGRLQEKGVTNGQFIAVLLRNHVDTVAALFSLHLLGVKAVILNNRLSPKEISWQIQDSGSAFLMTEECFLEKIEDESLPIPVIIKEQLSHSPFSEPKIQQEVGLHDVCSVMYTSGTTGNPKGVMQTYGNHWSSAVGSALNLGLMEEDCWLCAVPLFHISGYSILMRSLFYGMKVVLHEGFDEQTTIEDIQTEKVTIISVVTAMLSRLIESLGEDKLPEHFRCMLLGGGPAPYSILKKCVEKEIPVYQTYGMTETASQIVTLSPEYSIEKLGSAGKPLFASQVRIVNSLGEEAGPSESGEIIVKGPNVTIGYLNRTEGGHFAKDGWFHTGDIGYLDEDGFLFVQDRRTDLIISGGENIYPAEIEGILTSHPNIRDAGVIGISDRRWGQVPVAFIIKKGEVTSEEIIDFCKERLAKYKVPKKFYFVDELPRNASNKLVRRELRQWLENAAKS